MCPPPPCRCRHHLEALQEGTGRHWDSTQKKVFIGSCFPWSVRPGVQRPWKEVLGADPALFPECPELLPPLQAVFGVPCSVAVSRCQAALEESQDVVLDGLLHWTEGQGTGQEKQRE